MTTHKIIERSWKSGNERADNEFFWNRFGFLDSEVFIQNTDGIIQGSLFEFKNSISDLNNVLIQAIKYLSQVRHLGGIPVPTKIILVDINKDYCYVYDATKYKNLIENKYTDSASKNNDKLTVKDSTAPEAEFKFNIDAPNSPENDQLKKYFNIVKYQKFNINFPSILGWANYIYSLNRDTTKTQMFEKLRNPLGTIVEEFVYPWTGEEDEYANIMDALNDPLNRKDLGAFYTPLPYVKEATKMVRNAISKVPEGKDYIILDRCAGTGALQHYLTDEELSHVIINTYEIKEWLVLYNKFVGRVRAIIPPLEMVNPESDLVLGGDALSEQFLETKLQTDGKHSTLREIINDTDVVIIGLENPPYSSELARAQEGNKTKKNEHSFIRREMVKDKMIDGNHVKDLINQFIWSFEKYFMRIPHDSYIVFGPAKYWKSSNLMNKKLNSSFLANRGNFKATESAILVASWQNIDDFKTDEMTVTAKEIWFNDKKWGTGSGHSVIDVPEDSYLKDVATVKLRKVHKTLGELYSKKTKDDVPSEIATGYNGYETHLRNYGNPVYNKDIIAVIEASGFGLTPQDVRMTRIALYHGRGSQVRRNNYHLQLPLFVTKNYPQRKWYEREVYYSTSDKDKLYQDDIEFLRKSIIWTCISPKNHCLSFEGSDKKFYKNELCFDKKSLATKDVIEDERFGELDKYDLELIDKFNTLMKLVKKTKEYNKEYNYGTYQIEMEINTSYKVGTKTIYNNEKVNTQIALLKKELNKYYQTQLEPKLFQYELLK